MSIDPSPLTAADQSPALAEPFAAILGNFLAASRETFARQGEERDAPKRGASAE